jgi:hypothetical protein
LFELAEEIQMNVAHQLGVTCAARGMSAEDAYTFFRCFFNGNKMNVDRAVRAYNMQLARG